MKILQIVTTVHYEENGTSVEQLKNMAEKAINREMNGDTFTGSTAALVTFYDCQVVDMSPAPGPNDKPGYEYRHSNDLDRLFDPDRGLMDRLNGRAPREPVPTDGWVEELTAEGYATGRMMRPIIPKK